METALQHVQDHAVVYAALAACLTALAYVTRRWSVPILLYLVEFVIYVTLLHLFIHGTVAFGNWYRHETSFQVLADGTRAYDPDWTTPLAEAWNPALYNPEWLFYLEVALVGAVVLGMYRYRPLRVQQPKPKRSAYKPSARSGAYSPQGARSKR